MGENDTGRNTNLFVSLLFFLFQSHQFYNVIGRRESAQSEIYNTCSTWTLRKRAPDWATLIQLNFFDGPHSTCSQATYIQGPKVIFFFCSSSSSPLYQLGSSSSSCFPRTTYLPTAFCASSRLLVFCPKWMMLVRLFSSLFSLFLPSPFFFFLSLFPSFSSRKKNYLNLPVWSPK